EPRRRVGWAQRPGVEAAGERADQPGDDQRPPAKPRDMDAGKPRDAAPAADEQEPPSDGHDLEELEAVDAQRDPVVELQRDPEESIDDDEVDQRLGDAADRLRVADPEDDAGDERAAAESRDQRVDVE